MQFDRVCGGDHEPLDAHRRGPGAVARCLRRGPACGWPVSASSTRLCSTPASARSTVHAARRRGGRGDGGVRDCHPTAGRMPAVWRWCCLRSWRRRGRHLHRRRQQPVARHRAATRLRSRHSGRVLLPRAMRDCRPIHWLLLRKSMDRIAAGSARTRSSASASGFGSGTAEHGAHSPSAALAQVRASHGPRVRYWRRDCSCRSADCSRACRRGGEPSTIQPLPALSIIRSPWLYGTLSRMRRISCFADGEERLGVADEHRADLGVAVRARNLLGRLDDGFRTRSAPA